MPTFVKTLNLEFLVPLFWLARKSQRSVCLHLPSKGTTWVLGDQTLVFVLA